jgi:hypothetical protein
MILIRQLFSAFAPQNTTSEQENQCKIMRFEFRFLETHHSNWGKAPTFFIPLQVVAISRSHIYFLIGGSGLRRALRL